MFDASVVLRAAVSRSAVAREWLDRLDDDVDAHAPELIWIEVANGLQQAVRARILRASAASRFLSTALALPIALRSHRHLSAPSLRIALERGLSAYDASYAVLAEALAATLVTADRHLASSVRDSFLIT